MRSHLVLNCSQVDLTCSVCKFSFKRSDANGHRCEVGLLGMVEMLKKRVEELEAENAILKAKPRPQP